MSFHTLLSASGTRAGGQAGHRWPNGAGPTRSRAVILAIGATT